MAGNNNNKQQQKQQQQKRPSMPDWQKQIQNQKYLGSEPVDNGSGVRRY